MLFSDVFLIWYLMMFSSLIIRNSFEGYGFSGFYFGWIYGIDFHG